MKLRLPQSHEDLAHTADVGVRVRGATAEEALGRLVLAFATLATGGVPAEPVRDERLTVAGGPGLTGTAVALLRELLFRLATAHEVPVEVEIERVDGSGAVAALTFGRHDPERHAEGADVKAVTWHAARLEREGADWVGQLVFDIQNVDVSVDVDVDERSPGGQGGGSTTTTSTTTTTTTTTTTSRGERP